jgi:hypothetical protein
MPWAARLPSPFFHVRPYAFGGVEFGCVGGQADHGEPVGVRGDEFAHGGAGVGVQVVWVVKSVQGAVPVLSTGPFPWTASRTRRARFRAPGAPQVLSGACA